MKRTIHQTVNLVGRSRRATFNGREHIVVPMTMIQAPGVLSGSRGPLFYPAKEVKRTATDWNNVPILLGHPENGSGRTPDVINRFGVGTVFASKFDNGKLVGEAWFDIFKLRQLAPDAMGQVERGHKLELSTGFTGAYDEVPGVHNGKPYASSVVGIRPDHLAVFIRGERGACSVLDGCGINNCDCDATPMDELLAWMHHKNQERVAARPVPLGLPTMYFDSEPKLEQQRTQKISKGTRVGRGKQEPLGLPTMFG